VSLVSLSTAALILAGKLGLNVAEKKKWLPSAYYHKKSVEKLKAGDVGKAQWYNDMALNARPDNEKALVMRELISMKHESSMRKIRDYITGRLTKLEELKTSIYRTSRQLKKVRLKKALLKYVSPFAVIFIVAMTTLLLTTFFSLMKAIVMQYLFFILSFLALIYVVDVSILESRRIDLALFEHELDSTLLVLSKERSQIVQVIGVARKELEEMLRQLKKVSVGSP
jgi:hypothetical protein